MRPNKAENSFLQLQPDRCPKDLSWSNKTNMDTPLSAQHSNTRSYSYVLLLSTMHTARWSVSPPSSLRGFSVTIPAVPQAWGYQTWWEYCCLNDPTVVEGTGSYVLPTGQCMKLMPVTPTVCTITTVSGLCWLKIFDLWPLAASRFWDDEVFCSPTPS